MLFTRYTRVQPSTNQPIGVDFQHPLGRGLVMYFGFFAGSGVGQSLRDLTLSQYWDQTPGFDVQPTNVWRRTDRGWGIRLDGSTGVGAQKMTYASAGISGLACPTKLQITDKTNYTIFTCCTVESNTTNQILNGQYQSSGLVQADNVLMITAAGKLSTSVGVFNIFNGNNLATLTGTTTIQKDPHKARSFALVRNAKQTLKIYIDGGLEATGSDANNADGTPSAPWLNGIPWQSTSSNGDNAVHLTGTVLCQAVYNRALSDAEIQWLSNEPWAPCIYSGYRSAIFFTPIAGPIGQFVGNNGIGY